MLKSFEDWIRRPGGRTLTAQDTDVIELKTVSADRTWRFGRLYREWKEKRAQGYTHKIWVTLDDKSTRHDHAQASGQRVAIDDVFKVGGEELFLPSDVTGSFEQTANCRCKVAYVKIVPKVPLAEPINRPELMRVALGGKQVSKTRLLNVPLVNGVKKVRIQLTSTGNSLAPPGRTLILRGPKRPKAGKNAAEIRFVDGFRALETISVLDLKVGKPKIIERNLVGDIRQTTRLLIRGLVDAPVNIDVWGWKVKE